jgi:hypothetical protein
MEVNTGKGTEKAGQDGKKNIKRESKRKQSIPLLDSGRPVQVNTSEWITEWMTGWMIYATRS